MYTVFGYIFNLQYNNTYYMLYDTLYTQPLILDINIWYDNMLCLKTLDTNTEFVITAQILSYNYKKNFD